MITAKKPGRIKHAPHQKLKGYLVEMGIKQKEVARLLNISPVTLNQKLNGYLHFNFEEVEKICDEYEIGPEIFLTQKVAQ